MFVKKFILLVLFLLNLKLSQEEQDLMYDDEFTEESEEEDKDVFFIAGGIPTSHVYAPKHKPVVSLRTSRPTLYFGDNHFCAGTLVASNLVLTAARCVTDQNNILTRPRRLFVVAGSTFRLKRTRTTVEFKVSQILVHSNYVRGVKNDIAIIRLASEIPPNNDKIKVASMANEPIRPFTNCSIYGWGQMFLYGPYVNNMLVANVFILPEKVCKEFYPKGHGNDVLCATAYEGQDAGTCRGDSGGPLFCPDSQGFYRLAGVVAWTFHCSGLQPSIFTSIASHYDWIRKASLSRKVEVSEMLLVLTFLANFVIDL